MANENKNMTDEEVEENESTDGQTNKDSSGESDSDNKASDNGTKSSDKTFTQAQVTRMMTREKNQGRNAAYKELGIDPKDTKTVAMFKAFVESQKTDEQKTAEKATETQSKVAEAENRAMVAEAKAEAMMQGVKTQYVDDIVTLVLSKLTDDSDIKTLIGEFKSKYPVWFGEADDDEKASKGKTGQKGTGSSINNVNKSKNDEKKSLGARLAAQRKSGSKKSAYWGGSK